MATPRHGLTRALAVAAGVTVLSCPVLLASAADKVAFTVTDPRISTTTGLARDTDSHLYWTVNHTGSQGTVYGLDAKGRVQGVFGFRDTPKGVEALAVHDNRIYVGDIGDPGSSRTMVSVYFFDDPRPDNTTRPYRSYDFRYPDGAHDAATLLVDRDGRLYLVTKGAKAGIYAAPAQPTRKGVNALERVADAPAYVTDGVFLPDGRIVLRTYVSVLVLDGSSYKTVARAAAPAQKQGESVAVALNGKSLLLGSEGKSAPVLQVSVPTSLGAVPTAGGKPPATAGAGASAGSDSSDEDLPTDDSETGSTSRTGTVLALSLAALVAVVAGVVAGAARRR